MRSMFLFGRLVKKYVLIYVYCLTKAWSILTINTNRYLKAKKHEFLL